MQSEILKLNLTDFAKGILMFILAAIITSIYQFIQKCGIECVDWGVVLNTGISSGLAYILKNFFTDEDNKFGGVL